MTLKPLPQVRFYAALSHNHDSSELSPSLYLIVPKAGKVNREQHSRSPNAVRLGRLLFDITHQFT
jgi:hypothetical protein